MAGDIFSVGEYLDTLNETLHQGRAKIVGEVSGLQLYEGKSYLFFSLRDTKDGSLINCIMWKNDYRISGVALQDGLEIVVTAYPDIYKPNGRLTFKVELVELVGEGALKIAYEQLKAKLSKEGLFLESRKREIPDFPQRIGVITSRSGAVINDFLSNIGKFGFVINFVDSRVEGQEAVKDLLSAVETLKLADIDVLVLMRGGGSLESFQAFNNEALVRALVDFPVPVITGIGHDKDEPLVSLVSDVNVSTPTAVANLLNTSWSDALSVVKLAEEKIMRNFDSIINVFHSAEDTLQHGIHMIDMRIKDINSEIEKRAKEIERLMFVSINSLLQTISQYGKTIELANPHRQLSRGYSIVTRNGKIVRHKNQIKKGDSLDVMVSDGIINTKAI